MLAERGLQRGQFVVMRDSLDRDDAAAFRLNRQDQARANRGTIDNDGAGTADAMLAAEMRPGQPQLLAQTVGEVGARLDLHLDGLAVDVETDAHQTDRGCAAAHNARST